MNHPFTIGSLTTFLTITTEVKPPETARELADVGRRQEKKINYRTGTDPQNIFSAHRTSHHPVLFHSLRIEAVCNKF